MKLNFLLLATAATVALASCSQEKKTETTETTTVPGGTTETTTTTTTVDTASYRTSAQQLADQVAADTRINDAAAKAQLQQIYYTRALAMRELDARPDTTGRYAALRDLNDQTTSKVKTVVTDPTAYSTYTANQGNYYAGPYTMTTTTTTTTTKAAAKPSLGARVGQGSGVKKMERENDGDHKVKYENGAKIKRESDGSVKIKRADGTKIKIDEHGNRTVKKGLF